MISYHDSNGRFSSVVVAGGFAFLRGVTAKDRSANITGQTKDVLAQIDKFLAVAGTSKEKMVSVNIWMADISEIGRMNEAWMEWVVPGREPARATVQAPLAAADILVEIMVQASI